MTTIRDEATDQCGFHDIDDQFQGGEWISVLYRRTQCVGDRRKPTIADVTANETLSAVSRSPRAQSEVPIASSDDQVALTT